MVPLKWNHGNFLVLFYSYPIVPCVKAFLRSFLLLVTVVKGIRMCYLSYISTPWYWNFSYAVLYLSDSTLRTSIFA